MAMAETSEIPQTLLSAIQETSMPDDIKTSDLHPFSSSSDKIVAFLHSLLDTTAQVAHSVTLHSTTAVGDSRTVSLLREQSTGQHLLHVSRTQVAATIKEAEWWRLYKWFDDPCDDPSVLACISAWSSAAGMQAFPEAAAGTLVLGGKVVVLDVALTGIPDPTVHVSYAGSTEGRDSPALDAFFSRLVSDVTKGRNGRRLSDALKYLMRLDELAAHEGNGGARWFSEVDVLAKELAKITQAEVAFLAHSSETIPTLPPTFDVPLTRLYDLLNVEYFKGVTCATLTLVPLSTPPRAPPSSADPLLSGRPSFPLAPNAIGFSYDFPLPAGPDTGKYGWVLDFGHVGIVMSQSRMLEIARVVQPNEQLSFTGTGPGLSFVTGSWVDMLVSHNVDGDKLTSERYMAKFESRTKKHPPLRLTLTVPDEPGFLLQHVQVYNMQEVWAVLEIVREQCWLNEILVGINWKPEIDAESTVGDRHEAEATEEELRALLSGTNTPLSIPVNVYVDAPAAVVLTFPERPPMPGMVCISVMFNGPAGATVEMQGAMGADVQMSRLEGIVRRGGTLTLPGEVWAVSQTTL